MLSVNNMTSDDNRRNCYLWQFHKKDFPFVPISIPRLFICCLFDMFGAKCYALNCLLKKLSMLNIAVISVLLGELPISHSFSVHWMAGSKFQLCPFHVTLKMTYERGSAIFINPSAAQATAPSDQTRIYGCLWQVCSHSWSDDVQ